ncbi:integrin alpha-M-like [Arapaima gigas]
MSSLWSFSLTCIALIVSRTLEFSIDEKNFEIFPKNELDNIGYKVLYYKSQNAKWIVASAPLGNNGTGEIYKCAKNHCEPLELQAPDSVESIGMSIAAKSGPQAEFTACSPRLIHECDTNSYLNGICFQFNEDFNLISNITPSFQECTKRNIDLAFLFEGSERLTDEDFKKSKDFISKIMKFLSNTSIQFAAVQFSQEPHTVFDFTSYKNGQAKKLLREEKRLRKLANTYTGMNHILDKVLKKGGDGNKDATKVLVIITTSIPTDVDSYGIVEKMDSEHIIRYVIMVKQKDNNIKLLASKPENYFFINDHEDLTKILDNLQNKIYNIEGTQNVHGTKFQKELSQSGFSAAYQENTLVLGSVGSNDWQGSLFELVPSQPAKEIRDPSLKSDSYMGYSVAVGRKNGKEVYFSGAPRFEHMGQVLIFYKSNENWIVQHKENGQQIGSYFGAELCALDVDSNGETDFLLVGAPMYHGVQKEGKMYVFGLTREVKLSKGLNISGLAQGRFASSISTIHDLNGDGLTDVAVGAPLENDHQGAIYIYLGDHQKGLREMFSQHIKGQTFSPKLQFFGLSIDGDTDQGLVDIVVGAQGKFVLLKSRPVVSVTTQLDFSPAEISTDTFDCVAEKTSVRHVITLRICLNVTVNSKGVKGKDRPFNINVSYELDLDTRRQRSRAQLSATDSKARMLQSSLMLDQTENCKNYSIYMPSCVEDTRLPLVIKFNYSQSESEQKPSSAILNIDSKTMESIEVPFQRNCKNDTCISDLKLAFNFSSSTLLVIDQEYFSVTLDLINLGDDSYNTSLSFHYSPGLSFSKILVIKSSRKTLTSCSGLADVTDRTDCRVNHPVYPSQTTTTFLSNFRISSMFTWNETMEMTIKANSDNGISSNVTLTKTIPVQLAVDLVTKALHEDSVTYLNFSLYENPPKVVRHVFKVENVGRTNLPVNVTFTFKTQLEHNFLMTNYTVTSSQVTLRFLYDCKDDCKMIQCAILCQKSQSVQFILSGKVAFLRHEDYKQNLSFHGSSFQVNFVSKVKLSYNTHRYVQTVSSSGYLTFVPYISYRSLIYFFQITTRVELIVPPNRAFIVGVGAGGGLCLLILIIGGLYWLGFFKRKSPFEEQNGEGQSKKEENDGHEEDEQSQVPEKESDGQGDTKPAVI